MNKLVIGLAVATGLYLLLKPKSVASNYDDPNYRVNNPENPEIYHSTDDNGLIYIDEVPRPIANISVNYPTFTGGTFINPWVLPPVRTTTLQGGKLQ
jgi:hypothetical protein